MATALLCILLLYLLSALPLLLWVTWYGRSATTAAARLLDDEYWQARRTMNDAANQSWRNLAD